LRFPRSSRSAIKRTTGIFPREITISPPRQVQFPLIVSDSPKVNLTNEQIYDALNFLNANGNGAPPVLNHPRMAGKHDREGHEFHSCR
jgi:hypothetical protein